jgi:hypothetical protein
LLSSWGGTKRSLSGEPASTVGVGGDRGRRGVAVDDVDRGACMRAAVRLEGPRNELDIVLPGDRPK